MALAPSVTHAQDAWPSRTITLHRTVRGGRLHRSGRPDDGALRRERIGQDGRRRQPRRSRGHRGHAGRRDRGARRLYLLRLQHRRHLDRTLCAEGRLRSGTGPRADRHRELDRAGRHRQQGPAGEDDDRARVLRQGPSRQAQLRLQRRRRPDALLGRAVPGAHRNVGGAHSLQGRRAVDGRGHLRRRRFRIRQHDRRPAADRGRRGAAASP